MQEIDGFWKKHPISCKCDNKLLLIQCNFESL